MKIITYNQFDYAIKKQVENNIKNYGKSYSEATIQDNCHEIVECIRQDEKRLEVVDTWRDLIKTKGKIQ